MARSVNWTWVAAALAIGAAFALGCGGNVVVDASGGPGAGGGGNGGGLPTACDEHADCPGGLCLFSTGVCSTSCPDGGEACGTGTICELCGTSSCPTCKDCMSACVPVSGNLCDSHGDCADGEVCLLGAKQCAPACTADDGCANPNFVCDSCATSSCPFCNDCVGACLESF